MLLSLPLCHCPHFSLGQECLFPISSLGQCLLISQEPIEFLPLSEAFPDPLGVVPLLHGSSLSSWPTTGRMYCHCLLTQIFP